MASLVIGFSVLLGYAGFQHWFLNVMFKTGK
jgi:hypothetical protein